MRDLIPLREILKEINKIVFKQEKLTPRCSTNSKSFSDIISNESENPIPKSKVYEDNAACLKFTRFPRLTPRTKHIAIPYHWFISKVDQMEIIIEPITSEKQLADQFTKSLTLSSPRIVTNAVSAFLTKGSQKKCQNGICYVLLVKITSK